MFKRSFFKNFSVAALALTLSLGLVSGAFAAGNPPAATNAQAACTTAKWSGINPKISENALLVTSVAKGSPAAKAGLSVDQILISMNGKGITNQFDLDNALAAAKAGDKLTLQVAREGGQMSKVEVIVGTNSGKPYLGIQGSQVPFVSGPFTLTETTPAKCTSKPFELSGSIADGLFIENVDTGSVAAKAGLVDGEILVNANGKAVGTPDVFSTMVSGLKAGTNLDLRVYNPLNKKFSDVKIVTVDKTTLGAKLAVILEPASTSSASSTSYHSHMNILQDAFLTLRQLERWMREHLHMIY